MGDIHGMEKIVTLAELAEKSGGKYDTIYRKAKRKFPSEDWSIDSVLTPEHIAVLSGKSYGRSKKPTVRIPRTVPPEVPAKVVVEEMEEKEPVNFRRIAAGVLLIGVVVGHSGLVWYDCNALWGEPGLIGGGLVFIIALAALLFAADRDLPRTSGAALWFMFFVDCAAFWVHFPVFKTPNISDTVTAALCIFICASSFVALYLFRDSKLD